MNKRFCFLVTLVFLSRAVLVCGGDFPRHVDPEEFGFENPDPKVLFNIYSAVFGKIASGDYTDARKSLDSLMGVEGSNEVIDALSTYNRLLDSVIYELNLTESQLGEAYNHLAWLREKDAGASLNDILPILESVNSSSKTLGLYSRLLSEVLRGSPGVLFEGLEKVDKLIELMNQRIDAGFEEVEEIRVAKFEGLKETVLDVSMDDYSPWVGSSIMVFGKLGTIDEGLMGMLIEIKVGSDSYYVVTEGDGYFLHMLKVPYSYVEILYMNITYRPSEEDLNVYTPVSETVHLFPVYLTPELHLDIPNEIYPGVNYSLKAKIETEGVPIHDFDIELQAFNSTFKTYEADGNEFTFPITIPAYVGDGYHNITLVSKQNGVYRPVNVSETTLIKHIPVDVNFDKKYFIVSGRTAILSGTIQKLKLPLANCLVEAQLRDTILSTITDENGRFSLAFPQKLYSLSQRREYIIRVAPDEPWIAHTQIVGSIILVNTLTLFAVPLICGAILIRRRAAVTTPQLTLEPDSPDLFEYPELIGLPALYVQAVKHISRLTGVYLHPSSTIIEYLENVKPKLWEPIHRLFNQFSLIYERWIYGPNKANPPMETSLKLIDEMKDKSEQS